MDHGDPQRSLYMGMLARCNQLEDSLASFKAQFNDLDLAREEQSGGESGSGSASGRSGTREGQFSTPPEGGSAPEEWDFVDSISDTGLLPRYFKPGGRKSPYEHVLQSLGHAVHVTRAYTGEVTYWNRSAEKLYGWMDYEILGRRASEFLIDEEFAPVMDRIMEWLHSGQSWAGQFPFRKRSGEMFMAMVTKSPLYENGELVGVITVSSDAAVFNSANASSKTTQSRGNEEPILNPRKLQWHQNPHIPSVPQITSSVSNLASKVFSKIHGDDADNSGSTSRPRAEPVLDSGDAGLKNPKAAVAKIFSKLNIRSNRNAKENDTPQTSSFGPSANNELEMDHSYFPPRDHSTTKRRIPSVVEGGLCGETLSKGCNNCFVDPNLRSESPSSRLQQHEKYFEPQLEHVAMAAQEGGDEQFPVAKQLPSSGSSAYNSHGYSPGKWDQESSSVTDCEIHWDDLHLGEEVGQGSFAVVYRGLWNGSDVAIKVFFGSDYNERTLLDHRKEIDIMKRLRHPNVLLFMGACYTYERLAIVTEYLPRGSLFKTLHKSTQALDIRRRLRMALDVARGMNYLHRRNPPIVHRDLKSSNLLVDKNWTVKVGDFGLSRLKEATLLSAKSALGTPQWMAPEILRNEPSNEKSDVFSFGVILWELMTTQIPWNDLNSLQVVGVVGFMDRRLDLPESLDPRIASIITDCWHSKPEHRPSFQDIIHRTTGLFQSIQGSHKPLHM